MVRTEVLIIGGGPAGSSCAWALRRRGIECLILDRAAFPRPKPCAGWIPPEVLAELEIGEGEYPLSLTRLDRIRLSVRGVEIRLSSRQFAVRRAEFDDWLLRRSGVPIVTHRVREISRGDGGYEADGAYFGRYVVGAGGTGCPVARTFFSAVNPRPPESSIMTLEEEFPYDFARDGRGDICRLWFFEPGLPGYAWYVPKAGGTVNVGVGGKALAMKKRGIPIRTHWDRLIEKLARLGLVTDHVYTPKAHAYFLRRPGRLRLREENAFVIGDAAGLATTDMGEGIAPAVRSGILAAEAIATGRPIGADSVRPLSQPRPLAWILARSYG
jgi:flavin-dependent dehydrogenase